MKKNNKIKVAYITSEDSKDKKQFPYSETSILLSNKNHSSLIYLPLFVLIINYDENPCPRS